MAVVKFLATARDFSLLHSVQTGPGVQSASSITLTRGSFLAVKRPGLNPAEVVEFLRTEKFREQVLREGL
jgi:hypothetical protein